MGQYGPHSFKVRTTLAAYRIVTADTAGADYVVYPSAATIPPIGITMDTVKDTTSAIPVAGSGMMQKLYFNDTMSSGSLVASDSSGRGVKHADTTAGSYVIGQLIGPAIAVTGTIAEILINPFYKAIP
jgi:hypothetical protein